jgi:hypothetical protein
MITHEKYGLCTQSFNPWRDANARKDFLNRSCGKSEITDNKDGSYTVVGDSYWSTFTYLPNDWYEPLRFFDPQIFPCVQKCSIQITKWPWDEVEEYFPSKLNNRNFYTVSIKLYDGYDEKGNPQNLSEFDNYFYPDYIPNFDMSVYKDFGFCTAKDDHDFGTFNKKSAIKLAKYVKEELEKTGFVVFETEIHEA